MSDTIVAETPVTTTPTVVAPSSSGSTPPAESSAPANQAAADSAAAAAAKASTPAAPPADVAYTLALPKDAQIEASAVDRLTSFAKEHKLAPDVAQKALDLADAEVKADRLTQSDVAAESFKTMAFDAWPNEIKADKEFGGDNFISTVTEAKRASEAAWTPDELKILKDTGWGNHPLLVKGMARLGRRMANDTLVNGNSTGSGVPKTDGQAFYPGMNP